MGDKEASLEALLALRDVISGGGAVEEAGDEFVLGEKRFGKRTVTPMRSANSTLDLAALVYVVESAKEGVGAYIKGAHSRKVQRVAHLDRQAIIDFLQGKTKWTSHIDAEEPKPGKGPSSAAVAKADAAAAGGATGDADADQESNAKKRRKSERTLSPTEQLLRKIKKREGCQTDRDSILQSSQRFTEAIAIERDARKSKAQEKSLLMRSAAVVPGVANVPNGIPIIVVPAAMTAPINMFNVRVFLEEGRYVFPEEARALNPVKPQEIVIERKLDDTTIRFKVVDSVRKFQPYHWERLAAVFTQGPTWQFKDWIWKDTAAIFDNCRGLHIFFDDSKLEPHVRNWNVMTFPLKKQYRHQDGIAMHKIWEEIKRFLVTRKPGLLISGKVRSS